MKLALDAIYENGAFRPLQQGALALADGQRVRITIDDSGVPEALRLAMSVFDGLSDAEIAEVEQIALDRGNFFGTKDVE
jgi:predicted DNA-binding antitoxin AbrB/MazE fold protein